MAQIKASKSGTTSTKSRRQYLYIMVVQRLADDVGPGPIHVVKKVLKDVAVGSTVKQWRVPVQLEHTLPAGTGVLTATDKRAFAEQGLTGPDIAYVESKLAEKKLRSDMHKVAFEANKTLRLREGLKQRLIDQFTGDPQLAAEVLSAIGKATDSDTECRAPAATQRVTTLSDKVSLLHGLLAEVGHDIEAYKDWAKVGKSYDREKLRAMLSSDAASDWKLCWFAFSKMIDQATGTPFARPKGWASTADVPKLAVKQGYKSANAAS